MSSSTRTRTLTRARSSSRNSSSSNSSSRHKLTDARASAYFFFVDSLHCGYAHSLWRDRRANRAKLSYRCMYVQCRDTHVSQGISCIMAAPCPPANPRLYTAPLARTSFEGREPELVQGSSAEEPAKQFAWNDVK